MVVTHHRSKRKSSSGRYRAYRKKKKYEMGRRPELPRISDKRQAKIVRAEGKNYKIKLQQVEVINVADTKNKKITKVKMKVVADNKANRHYTRRNILTKGAIVETELGKVKITNRPGQEGCVNGVLVK